VELCGWRYGHGVSDFKVGDYWWLRLLFMLKMKMWNLEPESFVTFMDFWAAK
jgi:hypothetical protein